MKKLLTLCSVIVLTAAFVSGQQMADPNFDAKIAKPAYTKNGPRVLFDEAHHNFHTTDGGQTLKGPPESFAFLRLADSAIDTMRSDNADRISAAGRSQGIVFKAGKGRVVVMGEAAMLSAQLIGPNGMAFGMNRPGIDNRQLALNIIHWLSGLIK